ncbi:MAG: hypothetical protein ACHRXM_24020 [Isosphaerales bacterium]
MANLRNELKSRHASLRRLHDDLRDSSFSRPGWSTEVIARRTLGDDQRIELWFLAEHFLTTWSNWRGLLDRFLGYFGQSEDSFPKTWARLIANCDVLVDQLAREEELDKIIANSWIDPGLLLDRPVKHHGHDIPSIYTQIARSHERADLFSWAEQIQPRFAQKEKETSRSSPPVEGKGPH